MADPAPFLGSQCGTASAVTGVDRTRHRVGVRAGQCPPDDSLLSPVQVVRLWSRAASYDGGSGINPQTSTGTDDP